MFNKFLQQTDGEQILILFVHLFGFNRFCSTDFDRSNANLFNKWDLLQQINITDLFICYFVQQINICYLLQQNFVATNEHNICHFVQFGFVQQTAICSTDFVILLQQMNICCFVQQINILTDLLCYFVATEYLLQQMNITNPEAEHWHAMPSSLTKLPYRR